MAEDIVEQQEPEPNFVDELRNAATSCETMSRSGDMEPEDLRSISDALREAAFVVSAQMKELVRLRAQLATKHALGFKAGIEAAAKACLADAAEGEIVWPIGLRTTADEAYINAKRHCADFISSLPTPPSALPELLEAMRPVAEQITKADAARSVLGSVTSMHVACEHLRAIAAMFTKFGGKIDAE